MFIAERLSNCQNHAEIDLGELNRIAFQAFKDTANSSPLVQNVFINTAKEWSVVAGFNEIYLPRLIKIIEKWLTPENNSDKQSLKIINQLINEGPVTLALHSGDVVIEEKAQQLKEPAVIVHVSGKAAYARVGKSHLVDKRFKERNIFKKLIHPNSKHTIWINGMSQSEYCNGLGYYTANCMIALEQMCLEGKTVIDCGCGTGLLAIMAAAYGAEKVIGIDNNSQLIERARRNSFANGGMDNKVEWMVMDLEQVTDVVKMLKPYKNKPLVLLSNIGYGWSGYQINNISTLILLRDLLHQGINVSDYIGGGYNTHRYVSDWDIRDYLDCLRSNKMPIFELPRDNCKMDELLLEQMGFYVSKKVISDKWAYNFRVKRGAVSQIASRP